MWFYIKLAWRNVFRNRRRTLIASFAIGVGLGAMILSAGFMRGMITAMIHSATASFLGEAQIHGGDFRETQRVETTLREPAALMKRLAADARVAAFAPRVIGMAMISSPANVSSVMAAGVAPDMERRLSRIDDTIREGTFFGGQNLRELVIGSQLAEILEVNIGDRVVLTAAQAVTGDLGQEMFRVSGIYSFNIAGMDNGMAFVRLESARRLFNLNAVPGASAAPGNEPIHQIAVQFSDVRQTLQTDFPFFREYSVNGNEAAGWLTLLPQMAAILRMQGFMLLVTGLIMGGLALFGIINALFMSLYERIFEFAVMRAVGTRPGGVFKLVILEAGALGVISMMAGISLALVFHVWLATAGVDYRGIEFAGAAFTEILYPEMKWTDLLIYPLCEVAFTMLAGIYPAFFAARMKPADALKKSL